MLLGHSTYRVANIHDSANTAIQNTALRCLRNPGSVKWPIDTSSSGRATMQAIILAAQRSLSVAILPVIVQTASGVELKTARNTRHVTSVYVRRANQSAVLTAAVTYSIRPMRQFRTACLYVQNKMLCRLNKSQQPTGNCCFLCFVQCFVEQ